MQAARLQVLGLRREREELGVGSRGHRGDQELVPTDIVCIYA